MNQPVPVLDYADNPKKPLQVGTLTYTRSKLANVFFWMLWGDFCLNLMDSGVQPTVIPLQLKKYGMSMTAIGALTGTAVEIMSVIMVIVISTWSDRHRGPLGRRMPFMLYATPPLAACLIALGFSPQIAAWLQHTMPGLFGAMAISSFVVGVICVTTIGYQFFDLFPQCVYYYLFADVIPQRVMGTFTALFRVCATGGGMFFSFFLLKHAEDNPGMICLLAGGLYLVSFMFLALMVREGQYPPPEPVKQGSPAVRFIDTANKYIRECYSMTYYWKYYLFTFCFMVGVRTFNKFLIFYGKDMMHGDLGRLGKINTMIGGVQMVVFFVIGPLVDWFHPIRTGLVGYVLIVCAAAASFFCIHDARSYAIWMTITSISIAVFQGAYGALGPRLLPRQQYGQFCSAVAMPWHFGLMLLVPACGYLIGQFGNRFIFAWLFAFSALGVILMYLLYLDWKKLGGDESYVPPINIPDPAPALEPIP